MLRAFLMIMFSRRTSWDRTSTALAERVRQKEAQGERILDLTESNPTRCDLVRPVESLASFLVNPHAKAYHPDPRGILEARNAIAEWYGRHHVAVSPESVILTSGTSEAYSFLFSLLCDPGEGVLIPRPGYPLLDFLAESQNVQLTPYQLHYDSEWIIDWSSIGDPFSAPPKAMVVVHPNNPTGSYVKSDERRQLASFLRANSMALVADEVFWTYPLECIGPAGSFSEETENLTFVLSGLSKVLGLPQLKLSWVLVTGPEQLKQEALERLEMMGDLLLSVSMPIQGAVRSLLDHSEEFAGPIRERITHNLVFLRNICQSNPGVELLKCEGGWSAVLRIPRIQSDEEWALSLLDRRGVMVYPGSQFDFPGDGFLVVSLLPGPGTFNRAIEELIQEVLAQSRSSERR